MPDASSGIARRRQRCSSRASCGRSVHVAISRILSRRSGAAVVEAAPFKASTLCECPSESHCEPDLGQDFFDARSSRTRSRRALVQNRAPQCQERVANTIEKRRLRDTDRPVQRGVYMVVDMCAAPMINRG